MWDHWYFGSLEWPFHNYGKAWEKGGKGGLKGRVIEDLTGGGYGHGCLGPRFGLTPFRVSLIIIQFLNQTLGLVPAESAPLRHIPTVHRPDGFSLVVCPN